MGCFPRAAGRREFSSSLRAFAGWGGGGKAGPRHGPTQTLWRRAQEGTVSSYPGGFSESKVSRWGAIPSQVLFTLRLASASPHCDLATRALRPKRRSNAARRLLWGQPWGHCSGPWGRSPGPQG